MGDTNTEAGAYTGPPTESERRYWGRLHKLGHFFDNDPIPVSERPDSTRYILAAQLNPLDHENQK